MAYPLVSFLVPAYNHEAFVQRCLDSVLEEDYPNKDLLIINDGSSDRTHQKISEWIERCGDRVKVDYVNRPNRGRAYTHNEISERANGDYLRFSASDDYFLPGGTIKLVDYLLGHPSKMAVVGDAVVIDPDGSPVHDSAMIGLYRARKHRYSTDEGIRREVISRWAVGGPTLLMTKAGYKASGGWREDMRIEDWNLFLRLVAIDALGFVDAKVGAYRLHGSNSSRGRDRETRIANLEDFARTPHLRAGDFTGADRALLMAQAHLIAAKIAYLRRKPISTLKHLALYGIGSAIHR